MGGIVPELIDLGIQKKKKKKKKREMKTRKLFQLLVLENDIHNWKNQIYSHDSCIN